MWVSLTWHFHAPLCLCCWDLSTAESKWILIKLYTCNYSVVNYKRIFEKWRNLCIHMSLWWYMCTWSYRCISVYVPMNTYIFTLWCVYVCTQTQDDSFCGCSLQTLLSVLLSCYNAISRVSPKSATKRFFCSLSWTRIAQGRVRAELQVSDEWIIW